MTCAFPQQTQKEELGLQIVTGMGTNDALVFPLVTKSSDLVTCWLGVCIE